MQNSFQHSVARILLAALTAAWLASCGGGGDGPAIRAIGQTIRFAVAPTLALHGSASVAARAMTVSFLFMTYSSLGSV